MTVTQEVITRIRTAAGLPFRLVDGAAALANVSDRPTASPALYVMVVEQVSGDNERATGPVLQRSEIDIACVIIAENAGDERMAAAANDIELLVGFVRAALMGWQPNSADEPFEHVSGKILKARSGAVWFEDRFTTTVFLEAVHAVD
jgi:hypothetical protein